MYHRAPTRSAGPRGSARCRRYGKEPRICVGESPRNHTRGTKSAPQKAVLKKQEREAPEPRRKDGVWGIQGRKEEEEPKRARRIVPLQIREHQERRQNAGATGRRRGYALVDRPVSSTGTQPRTASEGGPYRGPLWRGRSTPQDDSSRRDEQLDN